MRGGVYELPSSNHMLSHLTHDKALKDYKYENARKLVKKQEDLLRNLAKTRENLELEEHIIGRTRDFYAGSRYDKYGYSIGRAEKLKRMRTNAKQRELEDLEDKVGHVTSNYSAEQSYDSDGLKFQTDIARLKSQVSNIAHRHDGDGDVSPSKYSFEDYPGIEYTRHMDEPAGFSYTSSGSEKTPKFIESGGNVYQLISK